MEMLELLARKYTWDNKQASLQQAVALLRRRLAGLRSGEVPLEELVVSQRLSREIEAYKALSPVARSLLQLQAAGKELRPGQRVRFVYTLGKPGVRAWDLPTPPDPRTLDLERYVTLLLRAASTVLGPFGLNQELIEGLAQSDPARQLQLKSAGRTERSTARSGTSLWKTVDR
jgi:DNA polymerase-2